MGLFLSAPSFATAHATPCQSITKPQLDRALETRLSVDEIRSALRVGSAREQRALSPLPWVPFCFDPAAAERELVTDEASRRALAEAKLPVERYITIMTNVIAYRWPDYLQIGERAKWSDVMRANAKKVRVGER